MLIRLPSPALTMDQWAIIALALTPPEPVCRARWSVRETLLEFVVNNALQATTSGSKLMTDLTRRTHHLDNRLRVRPKRKAQ